MNKNMFKRAWLNITRKRNKSIILLIIMFVIANLVLASIAISNSVDESTEYAKEVLGSDVYLNADMEAIKGNMSFGGDRESMSFERPETTLEMVEDLANSNYVIDYSYNMIASYEPVNFELLEVENNRMGGMMSFGGNMITAYNSYAFIPEVNSNVIELSEGTYFDENTDMGVIISYELAELNSLEIGSYIELENTYNEEIVSYEIIGIFLAAESGYENNIYMSTNDIVNLLDEDEDLIVSSIVFYLDNPENVDLFLDESNTKYDFEELSLVLDIDTSAYEQMAGPLESVGSMAGTILIVVVSAAVAIIALIINNNMKERKYEIGVLLSLGASKINIIGQMLCELVIVATVGFVLSMGTSSIIANALSDSLLENQLQMSEEQSESNFGRPTAGNRNPINIGNGNTDVEVINDIDVSISGTEYLILFGVGYLIVGLSMILPASNIMKYEPKTILTGRE